MTITATGPEPDFGFDLVAPASYFDLGTSASFIGQTEVCIGYSGIAFAGPASGLALFQWLGGAWVDATTSNDTSGEILCGTVTSLSLFAIFEPSPPAPVPSLGTLGLATLLTSLGLVGVAAIRRHRT